MGVFCQKWKNSIKPTSTRLIKIIQIDEQHIVEKNFLQQAVIEFVDVTLGFLYDFITIHHIHLLYTQSEWVLGEARFECKPVSLYIIGDRVARRLQQTLKLIREEYS